MLFLIKILRKIGEMSNRRTDRAPAGFWIINQKRAGKPGFRQSVLRGRAGGKRPVAIAE
jgi:hypothetical protein